MRIDALTGREVRITLSKRNLETLLAKLEREDSERTLFTNGHNGLLVVVAEDDATHYANREPGLVYEDLL